MYAIVRILKDERGIEVGRPRIESGIFQLAGHAMIECHRLANRVNRDDNPLTVGWVEQFAIFDLRATGHGCVAKYPTE